MRVRRWPFGLGSVPPRATPMKHRGHPLRVGLFALAALALLVAAIIAVSGGRLFTRTESVVMHFPGSVHGLKVGAPVVLRGVRVGSVASVAVELDETGARFAVPVVADIDRSLFRPLHGAAPGTSMDMRGLVQRGLVARLAMQSLLTGQLYVDLDFGAAPAAASAKPSARRGLVEVPTAVTTFQAWQAQLEGLDLRTLVQDVAAVAAAARQLVATPELRQSLSQLSQLTQSLARVSALLDQRLPALAEGAQATLADGRRAASAVSTAATQIGAAAERMGAAAARIDSTMAPDAPLLAGVRRASDELARSAAALRASAADDSTVMQNLEGALLEMRRASRAVRDLADLLERHPEALLRGRPPTP